MQDNSPMKPQTTENINNVKISQLPSEVPASGVKRIDRQGIPIVKVNRQENYSPNKKKDKKEDKKKQFKVTFIDKLENGNEPLARLHYVQSFKKFNAMNTFDPMDSEN